MILDIVKYPNPILRKISIPIVTFDQQLHQLIQNMTETLYAEPGIGLAAPQIGVNSRILLVDLSVGSKVGELFVAINPEILAASGEQYGEEGCLSVPNVTESVVRPARITVRAQDLKGEYWEIEASDLLARCFCHEIDHLDGILFIDRLAPLKRSLVKRRLRKTAKVLV